MQSEGLLGGGLRRYTYKNTRKGSNAVTREKLAHPAESIAAGRASCNAEGPRLWNLYVSQPLAKGSSLRGGLILGQGISLQLPALPP